MKPLEATLLATVEGDLDGLATVLSARHEELLHAAGNLPLLLVSRSALIRVLNQWRIGRYGANDIQQWAAFIRHGYAVGRNDGPIQPINIEYDPAAEETIVEIIGRLTEIGDVIDGTIDDLEQELMLKVLE